MRYSHHHNLLDKHNILNPNNTGLYSNYPLGPSWFPLREKTNLQKGWDNMFLQLGKTFFKGVSNPYAVYMGVGKIDYLEMPSTILDTKPKNKMNKKGLKIYLLEPLSTSSDKPSGPNLSMVCSSPFTHKNVPMRTDDRTNNRSYNSSKNHLLKKSECIGLAIDTTRAVSYTHLTLPTNREV